MKRKTLYYITRIKNLKEEIGRLNWELDIENNTFGDRAVNHEYWRQVACSYASEILILRRIVMKFLKADKWDPKFLEEEMSLNNLSNQHVVFGYPKK